MFRYVLVLLLVNTSYRSLGNPIPTVPALLLNSLTALSNDCENVFLSKQIKAQTITCSNLSSPHSEKQLQCLVFYDISKQLCAAVGSGKLNLPEEDYMAKINEEQNLNSLCVSAKDWIFTNLTEFSRYKQAVDQIFKHPVACGKVCGVEDFLSEDANFFCKYYKWGSDMLKQLTTTTTQSIIGIPLSQEAANVKEESALANSDLQDVQVKDTSSNAKLSTPSTKVQTPDTQHKDITETNSLVVNQKGQSVDPGTLSNIAAVPEVQANVDKNADLEKDPGLVPDNTLGDQSSKSTQDVVKIEALPGPVTKPKTKNVQEKPEIAVKVEENKDIQQLNNELENKQPVLETPNNKAQPDDGGFSDIDSEERKDDLMDQQGDDDGDDPAVEDMLAEDQRPPAQKVESVVSTLNKEPYFASPVQSVYPEENNEDHFFSFFLTAIILVVLLYVLYHNKNKVTKVFFGLVLEGRQGRRRNSRGHAYRRLDTLEQAMTTGSAAPPSKIIY